MKCSIKNIATLLVVFIFCISYSTNPPNGKTGAPGESVCAECHNPSSSSIEGNLEITGIPDVVNPNAKYTLTVRSTLTAGVAERAGFQMVALNPSNSNAGSMENPSASSTIAVENGRTYHEHAPALSFDSNDFVEWTVDWIAPAEPVGDSITFYASSILADGSGTSRDKLLLVSSSALLDIESSLDETTLNQNDISLFPNPAVDFINISWPNQDQVELIQIFNLNGQEVMGTKASGNQERIDIAAVPDGIYIVSLTAGQELLTKKLVISK